jgi:hypothetical protein
MTRSKLDLATILAKLRGDNSNPDDLAKEMTLMKLCHEIQKIEEAREQDEAAPGEVPENESDEPTRSEQPAEPLTKKEEKMIEEIKAPAEADTKEKKQTHILSWLLDSSEDES